jgi:hypothetical protein
MSRALSNWSSLEWTAAALYKTWTTIERLSHLTPYSLYSALDSLSSALCLTRALCALVKSNAV